jgi:spore maturation protein CgeB
MLTDAWEGLDAFFEPGREILVARSGADTVAALDLSDRELREIARAGRERTLAEHTSDRRAVTLERELEAAPAQPVEAPPEPAEA